VFSRDQVAAVGGAERHVDVCQRVFSQCGREAEDFPFCPRVPDPYVVARRGDEVAFGVPGHTVDMATRLPVAAELGAHAAGVRVPDSQDPVRAARSNPLTVGAERHAADFIVVLGEGQSFLAALVPSEWGPVPDANGPVEAGRCEAVSVRAERQTPALVGVTTQAEYLPTGRRVPDAHCPVFAARSKAPAVRADRNAFH